MKRSIALAAVLALAVAYAGEAQARNPHCAGGIQYVSQAMNDKNKGNTEDYLREIRKAVDQLQQCVTEDPADLEALGYLGWAYAEVDSSRLAGEAFEKAIAGLKLKGDPKKVDNVVTNRESYWATAFNDGISKINAAQNAYPDFTRKPQNEADETLRAEAKKNYEAALVSLTRAANLKAGDAKTIRNLGSVYAFMGDFQKAESAFRDGLKVAPGDSLLLASVKTARINYANQLLEEKKYNEAIDFFKDLVKADPNNSDIHLGLADAIFKRAGAAQGDARKADFKAAGDEYAAAAKLKPGDADLPFNAALAYQNAGEPKLAEPMWRAALKLRPDDADAMSALGSTLADLQQYDEAIKVLWGAVNKDGKNKILHRQLGAVYGKANNNPKSTEELMAYLALDKGTPVSDPAAYAKTAKAGTERAKTLATLGPPDQISPWEIQGEKVETWFYWGKKQAYHFKGDALYGRSDWSAAALKSTAPAGSAKK